MNISREFTYELSDNQREKYGFKYPTTLVSDNSDTRVVQIIKEMKYGDKRHNIEIKHYLKDPKISDKLKKFLKVFLDKTTKYHKSIKKLKKEK